MSARSNAVAVANVLSFTARSLLLAGTFPVPGGASRAELVRRDVVNVFGELTPLGGQVLQVLAGKSITVAGVARRRPQQIEKGVQAAIVDLLHSLGAKVYVLGTRRAKGRDCPSCGTFVAEHQGTRQTEGIADLVAFLPRPKVVGGESVEEFQLVIEVKAPGGRLTPDQREFERHCRAAGVAHIGGGVDAVQAWLVEHGYLRKVGLAAQEPARRIG